MTPTGAWSLGLEPFLVKVRPPMTPPEPLVLREMLAGEK
jgi:hypothetical protein